MVPTRSGVAPSCQSTTSNPETPTFGLRGGGPQTMVFTRSGSLRWLSSFMMRRICARTQAREACPYTSKRPVAADQVGFEIFFNILGGSRAIVHRYHSVTVIVVEGLEQALRKRLVAAVGVDENKVAAGRLRLRLFVEPNDRGAYFLHEVRQAHCPHVRALQESPIPINRRQLVRNDVRMPPLQDRNAAASRGVILVLSVALGRLALAAEILRLQ